MSDRKLNVFEVLKHINMKDVEYYTTLTEEQQQEFVPVVVQRWLSGTTDARQIVFLNEFLNSYVFTLQNHPKLLYQLMTVCSSGGRQRNNWLVSNSKVQTYKQSIQVISEYQQISTVEAEDVIDLFTTTQILEMAELLGYQPVEIKKLTDELKLK